MTPRAWILMPVVDCWEYTEQALNDCLTQSGVGEVGVLVVDNASRLAESRRGLELYAHIHPQVHAVFHNPPLGGPPFGALNASWNFGLEFCWALGAESVLVVNNDIRMHHRTYESLLTVQRLAQGLFVSAVGVKEDQFWKACQQEAGRVYGLEAWMIQEREGLQKGGPDFSCFLITQECHRRYPFDPRFTYFGDNDYHRTLVLGGDGERIFGVNVPYLHYGSRTVRRDPALEAAYAKVFEGHRRRYVEKWGGLPGEEKFVIPAGGGRLVAAASPEVLEQVQRLQTGRAALREDGEGA